VFPVGSVLRLYDEVPVPAKIELRELLEMAVEDD
jgi:hypothetical protein